MQSVAARMSVAFAVALVAFGLAALFTVLRMRALGADLRLVSQGYLPLTRIAAEIDVKEGSTARALELRALDPASRRTLLPLARAHFPTVVKERLSDARAVLARARTLASGKDEGLLTEVAARIDGLDARWAAYDAASRKLFAALSEEGASPDDPALAEQLEALARLERGVALDVKRLQAVLDGQVAERVRAAEQAERRSTVLALLYASLAAAVGVGAMLIGRRLLAPIRSLTEGVKAVAAGDLGRAVEVRSSDELGELAREFNAMAASLHRQRTELSRAERLAAVGRISSQITHEIRNPLNALGLNAELLAELLADADPGGEARALTRAIATEVDRLHGVTEEYLGFARLPRPSFALEELNELVESLADFMRPELGAAGVELRLSLAPGLAPVRADEGQLRAALLNLFRNAREAMPQGGLLTVATRPLAHGGAEVEVHDTGTGIPPEALPSIFEPFFSTKEKGTGLGLAFAQQVLREHGGSLACASEPGRGTTFTARLPRAAEEETHHGAGMEEALSA